MSQTASSSVIVTAGVPRELNEKLTAIAAENMNSKASEIRRAIERHVSDVGASNAAAAPTPRTERRGGEGGGSPSLPRPPAGEAD